MITLQRLEPTALQQPAFLRDSGRNCQNCRGAGRVPENDLLICETCLGSGRQPLRRDPLGDLAVVMRLSRQLRDLLEPAQRPEAMSHERATDATG